MPDDGVTRETVVFSAEEIDRALVRIAHEILEKNPGAPRLAVVGVQTRGAHLGARVQGLLHHLGRGQCFSGDLDVSPYRDDVAGRVGRGGPAGFRRPLAREGGLPFAVDGATVILVDDVLNTGRTARAAMEALFLLGRPASVQLAVLVDRGHRELPIRPDYVGKNMPTAVPERVNVHLRECDGVDEVVLRQVAAGGRVTT